MSGNGIEGRIGEREKEKRGARIKIKKMLFSFFSRTPLSPHE